MSGDAVSRQLVNVLKEAVLGPTGSWSYFTDNRPDAGLLGALATVSAAEASQPWAGSTIASHVHHVAFALGVSADTIAGDTGPHDWTASWRVTTVDDAAWSSLLARLRGEHARLAQAIEAHSSSSEQALGEAVGALAHVAYHLGAVRQKIAALRQPTA